MNRQPVLLCCSDIADPKWRWLEPNLVDLKLRFEFVCAGSNRWLGLVNLGTLRGALTAVRRARQLDADVIVAHGPRLTAWCAFLAKRLRIRAQIMGFSFNFTELPSLAKRKIFGSMLTRANLLVVASRFECDLYARAFDIPVERFEFLPWGVRPPTVEPAGTALVSGRYVCAIGGNARDYGTLLSAAARLSHVKFVLVVRPESLRGMKVPANVAVHVNLPLGHAMNILAFSELMVLPLLHSEVPCGHVTLVAAMHLGKPFVITKSAGVADYVEQGKNALEVEAGSPDALAAAIRRLWDDPALGSIMGENGKRFALARCSENSTESYFRNWLYSIGVTSAASSGTS